MNASSAWVLDGCIYLRLLNGCVDVHTISGEVTDSGGGSSMRSVVIGSWVGFDRFQREFFHARWAAQNGRRYTVLADETAPPPPKSISGNPMVEGLIRSRPEGPQTQLIEVSLINLL
jgi:hypothetical protein